MKKALKYSLIFLVWIGIWYASSAICNINTLIPIPYPHDVVKKIFLLMGTANFYKSTVFSLFRVAVGIFIAIALGILLAIISSLSKTIYDFLKPFLTIVKSTPVVAFIFLVFIVVGSNLTPIIICMLMVLPVVYSNVYQGIISADKSLLEVCKVYKLSFGKRLYSTYIPSVLPYFFSALLSSIGLGWKAGVAAEVLCATNDSVGLEIFNSKSYILYVDLFAWTLSVIILSLLLEALISGLLKFVSRKYLFYKEASYENK